MKKQTTKQNITDIICMLFLICYPLRKAAAGIDMMDAGYALGNYRFFDTMNETWKLATYLANVLGVFFTKLPFGDTWVGMNVYTGLLLGATAALSYRFLVKNGIGSRFVIFLGELIALSLCWAPNVILYHYLGYILMTAAVLLLYRALTEEDSKKKRRHFLAAGVVLGAAVAVRMPNITYMALILPVWYYAWLERDKGQDRNWFSKLLRQTGYCIAGYFVGLLVPIGIICMRYGIDAYPKMISSLFGMTETATDYKPTSMIMAMFGDYISYSVWLLLFIGYLCFGLVLASVKKGSFERIKRVIFLVGMAVLVRFCYGRGMFDFNYTAYFSMYKWITVFLLVSILLCLWLLISKKAAKEHKLLAVFLLVIIFVTPLGSNNGLYPMINNMFLVMPVTMSLLWKYVSKDAFGFFPKEKNDTALFACTAMAGFLCVCVATQSILFGTFFVFHDTSEKIYGYERAEIKGSASTRGIRTTVDKNTELNLLGEYLSTHDLLEKKVVLYGDIPAISYIYDLEPAVYTTWADLASNPLKQLAEELFSQELLNEKPLVIVSAEAAEKLTKEQEREEDKKLDVIYRFLIEAGYDGTYQSSQFCVYEAK